MITQRLLFVCLGNICRSPLVEAVARQRFAQAGMAMDVASRGTGGWHVGQNADPRMIAAASERGYDLSRHRAQQLSVADSENYDLLLAMDLDNLSGIRQVARAERRSKNALFLEWAGVAAPLEFPDPYYGEIRDFESAVTLAEQGVDGLIQRFRHG